MMRLLLLLSMSCVYALNLSYVQRVGDCEDPVAQGDKRTIIDWAQGQCPGQDFHLALSQSAFRELLLGNQGIYSQFQGTQEENWIWTDASYLFQKVSVGSQIVKISHLNSVLEILSKKYPFQSIQLSTALKQSQDVICDSTYEAPIQLIQDTLYTQGDTLHIDVEFNHSLYGAFWNRQEGFQSLKTLNIDAYHIRDQLAYSQVLQDSMTLWMVHNCGLAQAYHQELQWQWQPRFHEVKAIDQDQNGRADHIRLRSIDMLDSMKHWQSMVVQSQEHQYPVVSWDVVDSNLMIVEVQLQGEPPVSENLNQLSLVLHSTYGGRSHPILDGVAPVIIEAELSSDTLRVQFNERVYWGEAQTIVQADNSIHPLQWHTQDYLSWWFVLTPGVLSVGDSISPGQSVTDPYQNYAQAGSPRVMIQGELKAQNRILGNLNIPSIISLNKQLNKSLFGDFHFQVQDLQDVNLSLLTQVKSIPIQMNLPPIGNKEKVWSIQLDVYDQNAQSVLSHHFELKCQDLNPEEIQCDEALYQPYTLTFPWYGLDENHRLLGTGIYIVQVKVQDNLGMALDSRVRIGVKRR